MSFQVFAISEMREELKCWKLIIKGFAELTLQVVVCRAQGCILAREKEGSSMSKAVSSSVSLNRLN